MRCGVFLCECGGNISGVLDLEKLGETARGRDGVVAVNVKQFMCGTEGRARHRGGHRRARPGPPCDRLLFAPLPGSHLRAPGARAAAGRERGRLRQPARGLLVRAQGRAGGGAGQGREDPRRGRGPRRLSVRPAALAHVPAPHRPGGRRRHRRHERRRGAGRGRHRGAPGRAHAEPRRLHGAPRQDLPHRGLCHVLAGAATHQRGDGVAHPRAHPHRGQDDLRAARRVQCDPASPPALRDRAVRRLRRVRAGLPREGAQRVRPRRGAAHGHQPALRQRRTEHVRHRPQRLVALQDGLPRAHLGAGLRGPGGRRSPRRRLPRGQRAQPVPERVRAHLHARVRDVLHARRGGGAHSHRRHQALHRRQRRAGRPAPGHPRLLRREDRHRRLRAGRPHGGPRPGPARLRDDRVRGPAAGRRHAPRRHTRVSPAARRARQGDRAGHGAGRRSTAQPALRQRLHRRLAVRRRLQGRLAGRRPAPEQGAAAARARARRRDTRGRVPARPGAGRAAHHGQARGGDRRRRRSLRRRPHRLPLRRRTGRAGLHRGRAHGSRQPGGDRGGPAGAGAGGVRPHARRGPRQERQGDGRQVPALHAGRAQRARLAPAGARGGRVRRAGGRHGDLRRRPGHWSTTSWRAPTA